MSLKVGDLIPIGGGGYSLLSNVEDLKVDSVGDKFIEISWKDPLDVVVDGITITEWKGTQIRIKKGNYPSNEKDGTLVLDSKIRNQYQNNPYKITGLDNHDKYFIMAFPYTDKNVFTVDSANRISATPSPYDDLTDAPGPKNLISGTMEEGFFGEVSSGEFITGDSLTSQVGISQGTSQHSTAGWLKFAYKGEIQFVAKKPIRHSISWDTINTAKCVYGDSGDKTIEIGGLTYKVRLLRGGKPDNDPKVTSSPYDGVFNHNSEWNRLMCQIHEQAIGKTWVYPNNMESDIGILEHDLGSGITGMYNDADLLTHYTHGNGSYTWCQERVYDTSTRLNRGSGGVSYSGAYASSDTNSSYGWRPSLELVP